MINQNSIQLNIGDEIGFVSLASNIDSADKVIFFPVAEITTRDGERAYFYQYPDGEISRSAIRQSQLSSHVIRVNRKVEIKPEKPEMICLTERKKEFFEATQRADNSDLEVYVDFEPESYVVVNKDNGKEYRIKLKTAGGQSFADCECEDFTFRRRICKHISAVLTETLFGILARK